MIVLMAGLYFALLASGYFYSAIDGTMLLTERDLGLFFIPPRILWTDMLRHGEFPLWNPYSYAGHPLLATLQPGVLYPLNTFLLIAPFDVAFNGLIILHFMLAGVFTFLLLRELNASATGALIGALVFMLGGYLFSAHNVMSTLFSVTWAPLAVFVFLKALRLRSYLYAILTGAIIANMFMGGGVEAVFGTCGLLFFISVLPSSIDTQTVAKTYAPIAKRIKLLALTAAVFLLLSAVQLLPFLELARLSTRTAGLSWFEATTWSFDIKDLIQFFIPDPFGYGVSSEKYWANQSWLKTVYLGTAPFVLSVFYLVDDRRRVKAFSLLAALSMTLAAGRNSAVYPLLYSYFPFFNKFRFPVKFLFLLFLLVSISAGLGYDSFRRGVDEGQRRVLKIVMALLVLSTIAAVAFGFLYYFDGAARRFLVERGIDYPEYNRVSLNLFNAKRALFFFIAVSITLYAGLRSAIFRKALPYAAVAVVTVDLFFAHQGYYQTTRSTEYHKDGSVMEFIKKDPELVRAFVTPKTMSDKIDTSDVNQLDRVVLEKMNLDKEKLQGYNLEHKVFDTTGVEVMQRADYSTFYDLIRMQKRPDETSLLSILNVKYVVSIPEIKSKTYKLVKVIGQGAGSPDKLLKVYENTGYTPRFYTTGKFIVIKERQAYLNALLDKKFSPRKTVLLDEEPWEGGLSPSSRAPDLKDGVEVVEYRANSVTLIVRLTTPGILVASESWYPGWKAYIDGTETKVMRADYIIRAVPVPAGEHEVRLVYRPWTFRLGAALSLISLSAVIGFVFVGWMRKRTAKPISDIDP